MTRKRLGSNSGEDYSDGILGGRYPKIPTVFLPFGDVEAAKLARGFATKLLHDLSVQCGYNEIQAGAAAHKTHEFSDGSIIDLRISYGASLITVYVPPGQEGVEPEFRTECYPGFRCFIFAVIEKVFPGEEEENPVAIDGWIKDGTRVWYDISFCYKDQYVLLQNYQVRSAGWEVYEQGQYVLLGPAPDTSFAPACCEDARDLADAVLEIPPVKLNTGYLDVYPIHLFEDMVKKDLITVPA